MSRILKIITWLSLSALAFAAIIFVAGQVGLLRGKLPATLGVHDGRLQPPSPNPNSVSSQTGLYPGHPQAAYAAIAPLAYQGTASAALDKLAKLVQATSGCSIVRREGPYLYAQCQTRMLRFTDDLELWADEAHSAVQVRSASRLGRKDFGVNRARVEALRAAFGP